MFEAPDPAAVDLAIRDLAKRVMDGYDPTGYRIEHRWSEPAGMWFVEIEPVGSEAANIGLYHGGDTLSVYFGHTWFELYSFSLDDVPDIETLLRALCDGAFLEAGRKSHSFARIHSPERTWTVGHAHWPWPWRLRKTRRYPAYLR